MKQADGVAFARAVPEPELGRLVEPWLGPEALALGLPLPRLVDVAFNPGRSPDLAAIKGRVAALVPGATVEDLRSGEEAGRGQAAVTGRLALGAGLLAALALAGVIAIVTRMSVELHAEAVDLLRLMGAPDRYVARQFEHHALGSVLRGGLGGFGAAMLAVLALEGLAASFPESPLPKLGLVPLHWLLLGCVPAAAALLTALVARATARWSLARAR
jgi:cell division transport system permease protein